MKIIFFANPLKGTLCAKDFLSLKNKHKKITFYPLSDGGDGFLELIKTLHSKAKTCYIKAKNANGKTKLVPYLMYGKTAFLESAKIAGLADINQKKLNIMQATSFGIGQVIKEASKKSNTIFLGLGGVAFNDGGAGALQALGFGLKDKNNKEIKQGVAGLLNLKKVVHPQKINLPKIICFADVENKLLGPQGSAKTYGPQKGANKKEVILIERALKNFGQVLNKNIDKKYFGASGALPVSICGVLGANVRNGAQELLKSLKAEEKIKQADIVITSEGSLDKLTLFGKAPAQILSIARKYKKPVAFICGKNEIKNKAILTKLGNVKIFEISKIAKNKEDSFKNAKKYLSKILKLIEEIK